jgi:hypothetical protein
VNKTISRFAIALSLSFALAGTPAIAGTARDGDRTPVVVKIIKRLAQKFFGVTPNADPTIPIPGPNTMTPNP